MAGVKGMRWKKGRTTPEDDQTTGINPLRRPKDNEDSRYKPSVRVRSENRSNIKLKTKYFKKAFKKQQINTKEFFNRLRIGG